MIVFLSPMTALNPVDDDFSKRACTSASSPLRKRTCSLSLNKSFKSVVFPTWRAPSMIMAFPLPSSSVISGSIVLFIMLCRFFVRPRYRKSHKIANYYIIFEIDSKNIIIFYRCTNSGPPLPDSVPGHACQNKRFPQRPVDNLDFYAEFWAVIIQDCQ